MKWERKRGGEKRLKSLLLRPTAPRDEMRLLRVSEPNLFVETHPPRLCFKTKVKNETRGKSAVCSRFEKAMFSWGDAPKCRASWKAAGRVPGCVF